MKDYIFVLSDIDWGSISIDGPANFREIANDGPTINMAMILIIFFVLCIIFGVFLFFYNLRKEKKEK